MYYVGSAITKTHKDMPMHVHAEKPMLPNRMILFETIIVDKSMLGCSILAKFLQTFPSYDFGLSDLETKIIQLDVLFGMKLLNIVLCFLTQFMTYS